MLTAPDVLQTLRERFVNVWLLAKDLEAIAASSDDAEVATLCGRIRAHYDYPVDSVLIASDLSVVGHVNVHEPAAREPGRYLAFLRRGLAAARGEAAPAEAGDAPDGHASAEHAAGTRGLVLRPDEPTGTLLDVVRRRGFGRTSMTFFPIDATAFGGGGELEITVRLGGGEAAGRFELCAAVPGEPSAIQPVESLDEVAPGGTARMVHAFAAGARFHLAAMPAGGAAEGEVNAFLVTVTMRPR